MTNVKSKVQRKKYKFYEIQIKTNFRKHTLKN